MSAITESFFSETKGSSILEPTSKPQFQKQLTLSRGRYTTQSG